MRISFTPDSNDVEAKMLRLAKKPANGISVIDVNIETNEYTLEVTESRKAEISTKIGQSLDS